MTCELELGHFKTVRLPSSDIHEKKINLTKTLKSNPA